MNIYACGVTIRRAVLNPGFIPGDTRRSEECRAVMEAQRQSPRSLHHGYGKISPLREYRILSTVFNTTKSES